MGTSNVFCEIREVKLQEKMNFKFPADVGFVCEKALATAALIGDIISGMVFNWL
jgi:hypothetical protein